MRRTSIYEYGIDTAAIRTSDLRTDAIVLRRVEFGASLQIETLMAFPQNWTSGPLLRRWRPSGFSTLVNAECARSCRSLN